MDQRFFQAHFLETTRFATAIGKASVQTKKFTTARRFLATSGSRKQAAVVAFLAYLDLESAVTGAPFFH